MNQPAKTQTAAETLPAPVIFTAQISSQDSGNWYSRAMVSALALSAGAAMEVIEDDNDLQKKAYQLEATMAKQEGTVSATLGSNIEAALDEQASATDNNAMGYEIAGGMQGGTTGLSMGSDAYGQTLGTSSSGKTMSELNTQAQNVDEWEQSLNGKNPAQVAYVARDGEEATADTNSLRSADMKEKMSPDNIRNLEYARTAAVAGGGDESELMDDLREKNQKQKDAVNNEQQALIAKYQRYGDRLTNVGNGIGQAMNGYQQTRAADNQREQAEIENLKQNNQYLFNTLDSTSKSLDQNAQTMGQKVSLDIQLLDGMARANNYQA